MQKQQNSFSHILFSILLPVLILNKGHKFGLDAKLSVVLALSFPLFLTAKSLIKTKSVDFISLLGMLNVLISGTLTLLTLGGIWFAVKEAAFPLLIGCFVLGSSFSDSPFFETLFLNPTAFHTDKVDERLNTETKKDDFLKLMQHLTRLLSVSFLISSVLNFFLAVKIFEPLAETLTESAKQELLNEQLSHMTLYSMFVILIPSVIFLGALMYYAFKRIHDLTGLTSEELLK